MKKLLVYHSYTGNTRIIANMIKEKINCDVIELKPVKPFSDNYQSIVDEYQSNESDKKTVDIEKLDINLDEYESVIIGSPVWWYTITPVIRSFLKKYDLSRKSIYPFATNAGWLGRTFKEIENICNGDIQKPLNIKFSENHREHKYLTSIEEIDRWINSIKT